MFKSERGNQTVQSTSDSPIALIRRSDRAVNVSVAIVERESERAVCCEAARATVEAVTLDGAGREEGGMLQSPPRRRAHRFLSLPNRPTDRARDGPTPILSTDDVKSADGSAHAAARHL